MKEEERKEESKIKSRELMYKLIISQLFYDGFQNIADELAVAVGQDNAPISPSNRLNNVCNIGMKHEHGMYKI